MTNDDDDDDDDDDDEPWEKNQGKTFRIGFDAFIEIKKT